jgi:acyl carrier protein
MALSRERIMQLMQESLGHIQSIGLLEDTVVIDGETLLLGRGSVLDSLNLVAFISDIEERLNAETHRDLFLVLNDIHAFNADDPHLSVDTLVQHIVSLTGEAEKV